MGEGTFFAGIFKYSRVNQSPPRGPRGFGPRGFVARSQFFALNLDLSHCFEFRIRHGVHLPAVMRGSSCYAAGEAKVEQPAAARPAARVGL